MAGSSGLQGSWSAIGPSMVLAAPSATRMPFVADELAQPSRSNPDPLWRSLDFAAALILIVLVSPVLLVIAILIYACDPGPALFVHHRIGHRGRAFPCYKFRTMAVGAQARLNTVLAADPALRVIWERDHKLPIDPRVTRLGAFLRFTSLDELPQLMNVIRGEMSLVGPRPIVTAEVPKYGRYISHYYSVRPGLTGLWQVCGRSSTTYRRRIAADVYYARYRGPALNIRILVATLPAVLSGRGSC